MNKVFKVVWSKARNAYVVVSEIAKNSTKGCSAKKLLTMLIATGGMSAGVTGSALAANIAPGESNISAGSGAAIEPYLTGQPGGIAIGTNAHVENMSGMQEYYLNFGQTTFTGWFSKTANDPTKLMGSIAIGANTYARSGSTMIGEHNYTGAMGDTNIEGDTKNYNINVDATTIGANSYNQGALTSVTGAYSIISGRYNGSSLSTYGVQNTGATIYGSLNSIESTTANANGGIASSIIGFANKANNSNATLIWGSGNEVTNSIESVSSSLNSAIQNATSVAEAQTTSISALQSGRYAGGSVMAIGGGNKADNVKYSQLMGVQNTVKGTSSDASMYNMVDGYKNTVTNSDNVTAIGTFNTITASGNKVIGDHQNVSGENNIILSVSDEDNTTEVDDAVIIGHNAKATVDGGVALGAGSVASQGILTNGGWDVSTNGYSTETSTTWVANASAVSVGNGTTTTRRITSVAAGVDDTDAVNVAQLKKAMSGTTNVTVETQVINNDNSVTKVVVDDTAMPVVNLDKNQKETTLTIGAKDGAKEAQKVVIKDVDAKVEGKTLTVQVGNNEAVSLTDTNTAINDVTTIEGSKDSNGVITLTQTSRQDTMTDGEWETGKETTTSIEGIASTDYVDNKVNQTSQAINKLGNRVNKVGAGAAALAALHPLDFDPDDKLTFAAGYGNYKGENAAAIGAFYRPDEKVLFTVGGTVGNDNNMVNAGVSFSLDRTARVTNTKTAMAKEIVELRAQVLEMKAAMTQMGLATGSIEMDKQNLFPDVPENHWAYEYVDGLAKRGIIEGYPNGLFQGDRMMSRYEFAAMLYRAMQKGATIDNKILNEFMPEMGRIRVDRISGQDNDKRKVERVRVNGNEKDEAGNVTQYRDHYGSKISKEK